MFGVSTIDGVEYLCRGEQPLQRVDGLKLPGRHNVANALAAMTMGTVLGFDIETMRQVLQRFPGLPHRTQWVAEIAGVTWYNDSKATNVGAATAALRGLDRGDSSRTVLIAGGDCKGADFAPFVDVLVDCARAVVLIGRDAAQIAAIVPPGLRLVEAADMREAVGFAAECAEPGDRVLLSPACASFDMFSGYAERGDTFMCEVRRLGE
jgi:UDP-N-acetylmuramoylalanine--D-glutamate ligase